MTLTIPEILDLINQAKTKKEKIELFHKHQSDPLIVLMRINFDPSLWFDLPEGEPPFKKEEDVPVGHSPSNIYNEFKRFYIWLTPQPNLSKVKRENMFIEMLESVHVTEAEVVILCKDRKLQTKYKTITDDLVREAYPNSFPPKVKPVKKDAKVPLA